MLKIIKSVRKTHLIYGLIFFFYLWMAAQIPYTHDDWDWGLDIGLHQLLHATVNSRYAGNFFVVIMTRSELLKTLIMGAGYFLIPWFLSNLAAQFNPNATDRLKLALFFVCNCLLLTMKRTIWQQTYGWVAGYANFVISALFMMLWINEMVKALDDHAPAEKRSALQLPMLFVLSICSQLFLENLALYHLLLAVCLCVIRFVQNRSVPARSLVMLLGAALGLVIMFSSNLYDSLFSTGLAIGNVREIPLLSTGDLPHALYLLCTTALHLFIRIYTENFVLTLCVLGILSTHLPGTQTLSGGLKRLLLAVNAILGVFVFCGFVYDQFTAGHTTLMYCFDFAVSFVYFCTTALEVFLLFRGQRSLRFLLLALWLSAPIVIAPLVITMEIGSRLFFTSNIFVIQFAVILLGKLQKFPCIPLRKYALHIGAILTALLLIFHGYIYAQIGACKAERDSIIRDAQRSADTEICLPFYPFEAYLQEPNPVAPNRLEFFMEFYGIDPEVLVTFK